MYEIGYRSTVAAAKLGKGRHHQYGSARASAETGTVGLRKMGGNEPRSGARSCLQLMGSANLKVDCFDDVGDGDVPCLLESRLSARDIGFA